MRGWVTIVVAAFLCTTQAAWALDFGWARRVGGSGSDQATWIEAHPAGGFVSSGFFSGTVDFDPGPGVVNLAAPADNFVARYDTAGNLVWARGFASTGSISLRHLDLDPAGNVYVGGSFSATLDADPGVGVVNLSSNGLTDAVVIKLDAAGDFLWARHWGGSSSDGVEGVAVDGSGGLIAGGFFLNSVDFDPGPGNASASSNGSSDGFVSRFDVNGDFTGVWTFGGFGADRALRVAPDGAGGSVIAGTYEFTVDFDPGAGVQNFGAAGASDVFLLRLDSNGAFDSLRSLGGSSIELLTDMRLDDAGAVHLSGYFAGSADFDPGPGTLLLNSSGSADAFVCKIDVAGNLDWARAFGGPGFDFPAALSVASDGRVLAGGTFEDSVDFDPGPGISNVTATGNQPDGFLSEFDVNGDFLNVDILAGSSADDVLALDFDAADRLFVSGRFSGTVDFDPGPGLVQLGSAGLTDVFFLRLGGAVMPAPDLVEVELQIVSTRQASSAVTDFAFSAFVEGDANLLDATLTPPGGSPLVLPFDPLESAFAIEFVFPDLAALSAAFPYGEYRLELNSGSRAVDLDFPAVVPQCFAEVVTPVGACTVSPTPLLAWSLPSGCSASAIDAGLDIAASDAALFELSFVPAASGSVQLPSGPVSPAPLVPLPPQSPLTVGESYRFGVDVVEVVTAIEFLDADDFVYSYGQRKDLDSSFVVSAAAGPLVIDWDGDMLRWSCVDGAAGIDLVRGNLIGLADAGLDGATEQCVASAQAGFSLDVTADPLVGQGWWYLVRQAGGSYGSGGAAELPGRDPAIQASGNDCP